LNDSELDSIAQAWIDAQEASDNSEKRKSNRWAIDQVIDWALDGQSDLLWRFILKVYTRNLPQKTISVLAAGPLEDLIAKFGAQYIDQIEDLARKDPQFNDLLGGVWQNEATEEVWNRIEKARLKVW